MLVDPDDPEATRDVGIVQVGWTLQAVSPCCHAQLGWVFAEGGPSAKKGFWNCGECKTPVLAMGDFRADGFGNNATSECPVFSRAGWESEAKIRNWVAAWLKCNPFHVSLTFELEEE